MYILFQGVFFIGKQLLSNAKFPTLCNLLQSIKVPITMSMYQDEKACIDLIWYIFVVIQKKLSVEVGILHSLVL